MVRDISPVLRARLEQLDPDRFDRFLAVVSECAPVLETVAQVFPDFTRHDPSHIEKLEGLAESILREEALEAMSAGGLFVLLSALWVHDVGMGDLADVRERNMDHADFRELREVFARKGESEQACWKEYARRNHHRFCEDFVRDRLSAHLNSFEAYWIGKVARSHGERRLHERADWPKTVALDDGVSICPPFLGVVLRLADILHLTESRAPDFLLEHRAVTDLVSLQHWRAHQCASDLTFYDDACFLDGVTDDDEAFWFADQFVTTMSDELAYCRLQVLPLLDQPFSRGLSFSSVENRIRPSGFSPGDEPLRLEVNGPRLLRDLLGDALYAGKPAWFRELLQNAFDACRDRVAFDPTAKAKVEIRVDTGEATIEVDDTGVGMSASTVRSFLLVAAASYWTSAEYLSSRTTEVGHVGTFGVGFMSVFSVASDVTVTTRSYRESETWAYRIRAPDRLVRVERAPDREPGTTVSLKLTPAEILKIDPAELLRDACEFPECRVTLIVDGAEVTALEGPIVPTVRNGPELIEEAESARQTRLLAEGIDFAGVRGTLHVPKLHVDALQAFIPNSRGWLQNSGWSWRDTSAVHVGGIKHPKLHALEGRGMFSHVPNVGALRVSVSPSDYSPEMNLARDKFVDGPNSRRLHRAVCQAVDSILATDLENEMVGTRAPDERSAVVARYSGSMLHLWLGGLPRLGSFLGRPELLPDVEDETPFPRLTAVVSSNALFGVVGQDQNPTLRTIGDLCQDGVTVFAPGSGPSGVPRDTADAIWAFEPDALLVVQIPEADFGMLELRHWTTEEFLVPVATRSRSAYGLRLSSEERPFPFYPGELSHLGIPVASGPSDMALLDHRDFMAELKLTPTGGPTITAVLNRRHPSVARLIQRLQRFPDITSLRVAIGSVRSDLWKKLALGRDHSYGDEAGLELSATLKGLAAAVGLGELDRFHYPPYLDGGRATPFGRFTVSHVTAAAADELRGLEGPRIPLS